MLVIVRIALLLLILSDEGACIFHIYNSIMEQAFPGASKTPTTPVEFTDLAAKLDGGNGVRRIYKRNILVLRPTVGVLEQMKGEG